MKTGCVATLLLLWICTFNLSAQDYSIFHPTVPSRVNPCYSLHQLLGFNIVKTTSGVDQVSIRWSIAEKSSGQYRRLAGVNTAVTLGGSHTGLFNNIVRVSEVEVYDVAYFGIRQGECLPPGSYEVLLEIRSLLTGGLIASSVMLVNVSDWYPPILHFPSDGQSFSHGTSIMLSWNTRGRIAEQSFLVSIFPLYSYQQAEEAINRNTPILRKQVNGINSLLVMPHELAVAAGETVDYVWIVDIVAKDYMYVSEIIISGVRLQSRSSTRTFSINQVGSHQGQEDNDEITHEKNEPYVLLDKYRTSRQKAWISSDLRIAIDLHHSEVVQYRHNLFEENIQIRDSFLEFQLEKSNRKTNDRVPESLCLGRNYLVARLDPSVFRPGREYRVEILINGTVYSLTFEIRELQRF